MAEGESGAEAGSVTESTEREVWVVCIEHPGSIVRDGWASEPKQYEFLKRARGLAAGTWEPLTHDQLLAKAIETPSFADLQRWGDELRGLTPDRRAIAVDVECAGPHLVCVGMCRISDLASVCVRLRGPEGVPLWDDELPAVLGWLYDVLSDPGIPKWFHNGQAFDIPYLEFQGFEVGGFAGDTLLLQRYMFPEMGAGLQDCGIFYCGVTAWKQLASETNEDEKGDGK
jgi:hypothetical protein